MITLLRDNNNVPLPYLHLGVNIMLAGDKEEVVSGVIDEENTVLVRLACAVPIFFAIGKNPRTAPDEGIILNGSILFPLPPGHQVSVFGGLASLTVLG